MIQFIWTLGSQEKLVLLPLFLIMKWKLCASSLQFCLWTRDSFLFCFSLLIKHVPPRWLVGPGAAQKDEDESHLVCALLMITCEAWIHPI